jgi:CRISPR-associated endonuclease/helicase Cas3
MSSDTVDTFRDFFRRAMGGERDPYPYQSKLAAEPIKSRLIHVPTGCGKTAAVVLAWLWQRRFQPDSSLRAATPRRLVYCLPMRVLVDQTRDNAANWLGNLGMKKEQVGVHVLMGGEGTDDWDLYPERDAILVGTQDMLLSRALNRGYGMSRYRWPMHFGLLNNDCLWICDEVQLMGSGLATTTQLEAFRQGFAAFGPAATWWMSATADRSWLATVDYGEKVSQLPVTELDCGDLDPGGGLARNCIATKAVTRLNELTPQQVVDYHRSGTLTLAIANTVQRAQKLYEQLRTLPRPKRKTKRASTALESAGEQAQTLLIHSRFRPMEREHQSTRLLLADRVLRGEDTGKASDDDTVWIESVRRHGLIAIATQAVEAGVDISAQTLITELSPWGNLVQRFGRSNRFGRQEMPRSSGWTSERSSRHPTTSLN